MWKDYFLSDNNDQSTEIEEMILYQTFSKLKFILQIKRIKQAESQVNINVTFLMQGQNFK